MNETRAYLYSINEDGTLNVREGLFQPRFTRWSKQGRFTPDDGKWCYVTSEPCMFYHRKMWMVKRDDELARRLYVEYHEQKIKGYERSIEAHKKAIEALKGDVNNECI
jgi:hypothetical protein